MKPSIVVMLTHNDMTVKNAIEVFENSKDSYADYWGFKEIGIPIEEMKDLVKRMKAAGKTTFLEVVEYTEEEGLSGARIGVECGFDILMGTMYSPAIHKVASDAGMKYMPFVGQITGRPSVLDGTIKGMIDEANSLADKGVYGIDLLAYRYTGDPDELSEKFVKGVKIPVCLAGSIGSFERLKNVYSYQPWTFTIGSAFFENKFGENLSFAEQINEVGKFLDNLKKE